MPSIIVTENTGSNNVEQNINKYLGYDIRKAQEPDSGTLGLTNADTAPWLGNPSPGGREGYLPMSIWNTPEQYQDFLAAGQSQWSKRMLTPVRILNTAAHEFVKTLPGLVGAGMAIGTGDASWFNNQMVRALDDSKNYINESWLPIFSKSEYDDKAWYQQMTTADFWATQGADGIGFMLSMFGPGLIAKAFNIGGRASMGLAKLGMAVEGTQLIDDATIALGNQVLKAAPLAKTIDDVADVAKTLNVSPLKALEAAQSLQRSKSFISKLAPLAAKTKPFWELKSGMSKFGQGAELGTVVALNSFAEASAEASESYKNNYESFLPMYGEAEAKRRASIAARTTFNYNVPLLFMSNLLLEGVLLNKMDNVIGIGKRTAKEGFEDASKIVKNLKKGDDAVEALNKSLKPIGYKDLLKEMYIKTPIGIAKEGFFEEGSQFSIQKYADKLAAMGEENPSFTEGIKGIWDQYWEGFNSNDNEFWTSVALGGILGGFGEAGLMSSAKIAATGGVENIAYNRALFGGEERNPNWMQKRLFGETTKEKEFGAINVLQSLISSGYDISQPKKFFKHKIDEKTGKEILELDTEGNPILVDDIVNTFLANSLLKASSIQEIDEIKTRLSASMSTKRDKSNELDKLITEEASGYTDMMDSLDAQKQALQDSILYEHFKPLYDMGLFADDIKGVMFEKLKERKREELKKASPLSEDATIEQEVDKFISELEDKNRAFEKIYKEDQSAMEHLILYRPAKEDKELYAEWVKKIRGSSFSYRMLDKMRDEQKKSIEKRKEALTVVQSKFELFEKQMKDLLNNLDLMNDPEAAAQLERFKGTDLDTLVKEEFTKDAKELYKEFGPTGIKDVNGKDLTENEFVEKYLEHKKAAKEFKYVDNQQLSSEIRNRAANWKQRKKSLKFTLMYNLASGIIGSEAFASKVTAFNDVKKVADYILTKNSAPSTIEAIDIKIKDLEKQLKNLDQETETSERNRKQYLDSSRLEENFLKYKKYKKEYEEKEKIKDKKLKRLIDNLENSKYIGEHEIVRHKTLKEKTEKTEAETEEFNKLEAKLSKNKTPDYKIVDGKIYAHKSILLIGYDLYNLDDYLNKEEKSRFKKLIAQDELTPEEKSELGALQSKIKTVTLKIQKSTPGPKEHPERFTTKIFETSFSGLELVQTELKDGVNTKAFHERYEVSVYEKGSDDYNAWVRAFKYSNKYKDRVKRIRKGNQILAQTEKTIEENQSFINVIEILRGEIINFMLNQGEQESDKAIENLNAYLDSILLDNGFMPYDEVRLTVAKLKGIIKQGDKFVMLSELQKGVKYKLDGDKEVELDDTDMKIVNDMISSRGELGDIPLKDALNSLNSKPYYKKSKIYYSLLRMRNAFLQAAVQKRINDKGEVELIKNSDTISEAYAAVIETINQEVDNVETDIKNAKEILNTLKADNAGWREAEFDIKEMYQDINLLYGKVSLEVSQLLGNPTFIPGLPQFITDIRTSVDRIDKIIEEQQEKLNSVLKQLELIKKLRSPENDEEIDMLEKAKELHSQVLRYSMRLSFLENKLYIPIPSANLTDILTLFDDKTDSSKDSIKALKALLSRYIELYNLKNLPTDLNKKENLLAVIDHLSKSGLKTAADVKNALVKGYKQKIETAKNNNVYTITKLNEKREQIEKVMKELNSLFDQIKDQLKETYTINQFYKKMYPSFGKPSGEDVRSEAFEDNKQFSFTKSAKPDSVFTLSTVDILYRIGFLNGVESFQDDEEEVEHEGQILKVSKETTDEHQLAFQSFISSAKGIVKDYKTVSFGMAFLLNKGIFFKTEDGSYGFNKEKLTIPQKEHADVFVQLLAYVNDYVKSLTAEEKEGAVKLLEKAIYFLPFDTTKGLFYSKNGKYAITAIMSPKKRINNVQQKGLYYYILQRPDLMQKLFKNFPALEYRRLRGGSTLNRAIFFELMKDLSTDRQLILQFIEEDYSSLLTSLSESDFRGHNIRRFGKGFKVRVRDRQGKRYTRNFTEQEVSEVAEVLVVQRHWNNESKENKKGKVSYTSNVFTEEKYFGLVSVKYQDGTEELVDVRNLEEEEAITVMELIRFSFSSEGQGKDTQIQGVRVFPSKPTTEQKQKSSTWERGLIQSLIRWGTTQDVEVHSNQPNYSKNKKQHIETKTARPYDIWINKKGTDHELKWIDQNGNMDSILVSEIKKADGSFDQRLMNFLKLKQINVNSKRTSTINLPRISNGTIVVDKNVRSKVFYLRGNEHHAPVVKTSSVPGKPRVGGRIIDFEYNNVASPFDFKKVVTASTETNSQQKKIKTPQLKDGKYKVTVTAKSPATTTSITRTETLEIKNGKRDAPEFPVQGMEEGIIKMLSEIPLFSNYLVSVPYLNNEEKDLIGAIIQRLDRKGTFITSILPLINNQIVRHDNQEYLLSYNTSSTVFELKQNEVVKFKYAPWLADTATKDEKERPFYKVDSEVFYQMLTSNPAINKEFTEANNHINVYGRLHYLFKNPSVEFLIEEIGEPKVEVKVEVTPEPTPETSESSSDDFEFSEFLAALNSNKNIPNLEDIYPNLYIIASYSENDKIESFETLSGTDSEVYEKLKNKFGGAADLYYSLFKNIGENVEVRQIITFLEERKDLRERLNKEYKHKLTEYPTSDILADLIVVPPVQVEKITEIDIFSGLNSRERLLTNDLQKFIALAKKIGVNDFQDQMQKWADKNSITLADQIGRFKTHLLLIEKTDRWQEALKEKIMELLKVGCY